jgi:hypothetical protein
MTTAQRAVMQQAIDDLKDSVRRGDTDVVLTVINNLRNHLRETLAAAPAEPLSDKHRKAFRKRAPPLPSLVFPRADPQELADFDPATKRCTMNCGAHASDPRSTVERLFLCDECDPVPVAQLCNMCGYRGQPSHIDDCPRCGWDAMTPQEGKPS